MNLDIRRLLNYVKTGTVIKEKHIITILYNSLCALNFIHSADILHRDIKPANLLIDDLC